MSLQSETRKVIVELQAPADIKFVSVEPEKSEYLQGETVKFNFTIKNEGGSRADNPSVLFVDTDTGERLVSLTTVGLNPGAQFTIASPVTVGSMPNHDWDLTVTCWNLG